MVRGARSLLALAAVLASITGCADRSRPPVVPTASPLFVAVPIACRVDADEGVGRCSTGEAQRGPDVLSVHEQAAARAGRLRLPEARGFFADAVLGAQAASLSVGGVAREPGGGPLATYSLQVTLANLLDQAMGLAGNDVPDTAGVRVFVEKGPDGEGSPSATAEWLNPDVTGATGSGPGQSAISYASPIIPGGSSTREWRVRIGGGATGFSFRAVVLARLTDESPAALNAANVGITDIRQYGNAACALTTTGRVYCWGDNQRYGFGAGMTALGAGVLATPADVPLSVTEVALLSSSPFWSPTLCGVRRDGAISCRGATSFAVPPPDTGTWVIPSTVALTSVVLAPRAACGLDAGGTAWCHGQGDGPLGSLSASTASFTKVDGVTRFTRIVAGERFVCALSTAGRPWCWGANDVGQLGRILPGGATSRSFPVAVSDSSTSVTYSAIAAARAAACALDADGAPWCWGSPDDGQLGDGGDPDAEPRFRAGRVGLPPGTRLVSLVAGAASFCGLTAEGALYCWGRNTSGMLDESREPVSAAQPVQGSRRFRTVALATESMCGVQRGGLDDGRVVCWGRAGNGILGQPASVAAGDPDAVLTPRAVAGLSPNQVDRVAMSGDGSKATACAWSTASRRVWCWGMNVGSGSYERRPLSGSAPTFQLSPVGLPTGRRFSQVSVGGAGACGIEQGTKALFCWGAVPDGAGSFSDAPVRISLPDGRVALQVANGAEFGCVLASNDDGASDRRLYCFGKNGYGQVGNGTTTVALAPAAVAGNGNWRSVSAGEQHACAIEASSSKVWCWGDVTYGQVGSPASAFVSSPRVTAPAVTADTVVSGRFHTCARSGTSPAKIRCWGSNAWGQLGRTTFADKDAQGDSVRNISSSTFLTAAGNSTCSVGTDGLVTCWGNLLSLEFGLKQDVATVVDGGMKGARVSLESRYCQIRPDVRAQCRFSYPGDGSSYSATFVPLRLPVAGVP